MGVIDKQDILKRACGAYPNIRQYGILNLEIQVTRNGAIFENLKKSTLKILPASDADLRNSNLETHILLWWLGSSSLTRRRA